MATPIPRDAQQAIANAGAGPLADLAKMAGDNFALSKDEARCYGAGFVSDLLRMAEGDPVPPVDPPYTAVVENIANANPANIKVSATDFPFFPVGTQVTFAGTGEPILDEAVLPFTVDSVNTVGKTFKINCDLSALSASIVVGTVTTVPQAAARTPLESILDHPPPVPTLEPQVPNGYEQWAEDVAKAAKEA